jgi:phosphoglycolate phosphatase-like HAD superfamily hydrolase
MGSKKLSLYKRFREEILAGVAIIVPAAAGYLYSEVANDQIRTHLVKHWATYLLTVITTVLVAYSLLLHRRLRKKDSALVRFAPDDDRRYRNVIDLTTDIYYLLGMSAEEFQRDIALKEYLLNRAKTGNPIKQLRFLLLHPDSDHFSDRLLEINPGSNLKALIQRKKEIIRSLYLGLASLPSGILDSFEIRFFDTYPVWIMQFFKDDAAPGSTTNGPTGLVLSFHLRGIHSKFSEQYLLRAEKSGLFDSFLNYFQRKWETSLPMGSDGTFPKIFSPERQSVKLLIFDFDGTIIESNEAKREVFFEVYDKVTNDQKKRLGEVYRKRGGLPRSDLFKLAQTEMGDAHPSKETLLDLQRKYSENYLSRIDKVKLVEGFERFHQLFATKYRFAIASNAPLDEVTEVLKRKKIYDYFSYVSGYPTTKVEAVKTAFKTFDLEAENVLYVGDGEEDRLVCSALGVRFIVRSDTETSSMESDRTYFFGNYDDLSRVIYRIELERFEAAGTPETS